MINNIFSYAVVACALTLLLNVPLSSPAQEKQFKVIAFYSTTVESDHVDFANDAIRFFKDVGAHENFVFDTTTNWQNLNENFLKTYQVITWLNDFPQNDVQRKAFEDYMEHKRGAWLGFHVAAYNDSYTKWKWFVAFLGGAVFYTNNWPPLPAKLNVENRAHPVTSNTPNTFIAPINEWYQWLPSPRLDKDVKVLISLDSSNYPLGKKDLILHGDVPVVWTNTRYNMLYMNMGHGDLIFSDSTQNNLFKNAILWLGRRKK